MVRCSWAQGEGAKVSDDVHVNSGLIRDTVAAGGGFEHFESRDGKQLEQA